MFNKFFFENFSIYEMMWKNIVELGGPQMTIWCRHIICKGYKHTLRICNTDCFSTATVVARTCFRVMLYI